jgi:hypothetical protein
MTSVQRQLRVLTGILFILLLVTTSSVQGAPSNDILYVKHDAAGSNDGSSWPDAYTDLQDALDVAQAGDEIWVAQGVYYPASNALDRSATFELQDGVGLYGGFAGTETQRDQRDWEANVTVLSGDLDGNDTTDDNGLVADTDDILGRNAYHVVTAGGADDNRILDGFAVTAGLADGDSEHPEGGGMYVDSGGVFLVNVTFSGNKAWYGGGMCSWDSSTLTNVTFSGNTAAVPGAKGGAGGGMFTGHSSTLTNVIFTGNHAWYGGGLRSHASGTSLTNVGSPERTLERSRYLGTAPHFGP